MTIKRIPLSQFREAAVEDPSLVALVPKGHTVEVKEVDGESRVREFVASTADVDRDNDTIAVDGWDLTDYAKNPVFLWAHSRDLPPIGRAAATWVEDGALKQRVKFADRDMEHPMGRGFGHSVMRMYDERILSAVSVGFSPKEWSFNEDRGSYAIDFKRQELLEVSAVPVPSNPNALMQARSKGIDVEAYIAWAETVRDDETGLWLMPDGKTTFASALAKLLDATAKEKLISVPAPAVVDEPEETDQPLDASNTAADKDAKGTPDLPDGDCAEEADGNAGVDKTDPEEPEDIEAAYAATLDAATKAEGAVVEQIYRAVSMLEKQGRVLSAANEGRLRQAHDLLAEVLQAVDPQEEGEEPDETKTTHGAPVNADQLKAIIDEVLAKQLAPLTGRLAR